MTPEKNKIPNSYARRKERLKGFHFGLIKKVKLKVPRSSSVNFFSDVHLDLHVLEVDILFIGH